MPQLQLPIFPKGLTHITNELGFELRDDVVTYFLGQLPVCRHASDDVRTFRMMTSQFVVDGNARQVDIQRAFGVPAISVKRGVKCYRDHGPGGFYAPRNTRGAAVLTPDVIERLQELLDEGVASRDAARQLGLKPDTVAKAVRAGRLHGEKKVRRPKAAALQSR